MRLVSWSRLLVTIGAALLAPTLAALQSTPGGTSPAEPTRLDGAALFKTYCASCHGTSAKGDGPVASHLRRRPPDLTRLAKRNRGAFDAEWIARVIDGRRPLKGHGGAEMPVWGDAFQGTGGTTAQTASARIDAVVQYLKSIQGQ